MYEITEDVIRKEWFSKHAPTYRILEADSEGPVVEHLRWREPGTIHYLVDYLRMDNRLYVSGDIGEATYAW